MYAENLPASHGSNDVKFTLFIYWTIPETIQLSNPILMGCFF